MTKKELRLHIKGKINALPVAYKKGSGEKIARWVMSSVEYINAESIFCYVSTENEPDTSLIIRDALSTGKRVFVPKCISKGIMVPVEINKDTVFEVGYMGICEPVKYEADIKPDSLDLSVIPCLCAGPDGNRLGHGAGFYDRFLSKTGTVKFCLCFGELITADIPTDEYDIAMDAVITENGITRVNFRGL